MTRARLLALVAILALAACTGGGDADDGGPAADGATTAADGTTGADAEVAADGATSTEQVGGGVVPATVELVAPPEEGAGEVPTFEWEPVDGAAAYRLVVLDADGTAVWAWEGPETSVALGGVPNRPEGAEGPVLTAGSTWSVVALDADGHVVAVSAARPASP